MSSFQRVKEFLENVEQENIKFKQHFFDRVQERPISKEMARKCLKQTNLLLKVEDQPARTEGEEKYKLWIKLSNKYSLVLIVAIRKKVLNIITGWNTDRKWQKSIQR